MTKPRKGQEYTPVLDLLLRDAQPTWREVAGEPDARKRRKNERARDLATDKLLAIYRDHERQGSLRELDIRVWNFCEGLKQRNEGVLPKKKGGRPSEDDAELLIAVAVAVAEAVASQTGKRKNLTRAIKQVSERVHKAETTVRDVYYRRDPEWQRDINAKLARRAYEHPDPEYQRAIQAELARRKAELVRRGG
jgi:hypothetical protein